MAAPDRREDGAPRRLMTPVAAADYLGGIAKQTLAKWRCLGGGPEFVRVGSRIFYEHRALDAWLDARRRTSTSEVTSPPRGNRSPVSGGAPVGTTGNHTTDSTSARAPSAGLLICDERPIRDELSAIAPTTRIQSSPTNRSSQLDGADLAVVTDTAAGAGR